MAKKDEKTNKNVGSSEFQITLFTDRIKKLTEHLKLNKKDENTRRGLMKMVGKRKKLFRRRDFLLGLKRIYKKRERAKKTLLRFTSLTFGSFAGSFEE